jgi:hypothetical protein
VVEFDSGLHQHEIPRTLFLLNYCFGFKKKSKFMMKMGFFTHFKWLQNQLELHVEVTNYSMSLKYSALI